jgi:hypothetical protein
MHMIALLAKKVVKYRGVEIRFPVREMLSGRQSQGFREAGSN